MRTSESIQPNSIHPKQESAARRARIWLEHRGVDETVLKITLAVMLAWEVGLYVPGGSTHPYFAPLAAMLSFQVTIADSISAAFQRVAGIVAGVAVALAVTLVAGENAIGLGLLVFLALVLGSNLRLNQSGISQVAVSALIVMIVGGSGNLSYAGARILDSIVGAIIGVTVNALLVPPTALPEAQTAKEKLAVAVSGVLDELAGTLKGDLTREKAAECLAHARELVTPINQAREALEKAGTSLKYNPIHRMRHSQLDVYRRDIVLLEHTAIQTRVIARSLNDAVTEAADPEAGEDWMVLRPLSGSFADLLYSLSEAVVQFAIRPEKRTEETGDLQEALADIKLKRQELDKQVTGQETVLTPKAWMYLGATLANADYMAADLNRYTSSE